MTSSTKLSPGRHGISCPCSAGREGPFLGEGPEGPSPRTVSTQGRAGPHRLTWPLRHTARPSRVSREWVCGQPRSPSGGGERPGGQGPPSSEPTHPPHRPLQTLRPREQARGTVVGCTRPRAGPWRRAGDPRPGGWLPGGCHPPPSGGKGGTGREQPAAGDWGPDTPGAPSSAPGPRPSAPAGKQRAACPSPAAVTYLATWPHSSVLAFPLTHPRLPSLPVIYKAAGA